ncbi:MULTISPECIES: TerC family protein [unclassified Lactobacillus]|uniref:TerC family protein n=1 Tax=unclassified Lactobacillus TaxID=2620435 RepID=UPI0023F7A70F|nr:MULTISPECIES: TerC family protein [unclassified Lactobacillus]MDF7669228.1 TerC family protein [Lactobacillus sp. ESL0703]WEV38783.1 TerC family protein [Lactobacillus sp. ESL0680]
MSIINSIIKMYAPFFSASNWLHVLTSGKDWMIILTLILMECLLSVDNAVVLAAQTKALPDKKQQEKSLFYGLWGAYIFRFIVIGIGTYLINFWEIKLAGSFYLFYLAVKFFYDQRHPQKAAAKEKAEEAKLSKHQTKKGKHVLSLFWRTVISIEAMDIVFSIDSVLAALAVSSNPVIVLIGGMIGILCMRGVAEVIIKLMDIIPELQPMAYILIGIIALKLLLSLPPFNYELPNTVFAMIVFGILLLTIAFHFWRVKRHGHKKL